MDKKRDLVDWVTLSPHRKHYYHLLVWAMTLLFAFSVYWMVKQNIARNMSVWADSILNATAMVFVLLLMILCLTGHYSSRRSSFYFGILMIIAFVGDFFASLAYACLGMPEYASLILYCETVIYLSYPVLWFVFWLYHRDKLPKTRQNRRITLTILAYVLVCAVIYVVNLFIQELFYVSETGALVFTRYSVIFAASNALVVLYYLFYVAYAKDSARVKLALVAYLIFPLCGMIIDALFSLYNLPMNPEPLENIFVALGAYLVFFNVYLERGRKLAAKDKAMNELQINTMLLQANPHFIYNTLGSIESLCESDPKTAASVVRDFSSYLRGNYSNMTSEPMVTFSEERKHLDSYLRIEQVRFPNIEVEYDIRVSDFSLPCLSVQPLVENAIKHGICKRRQSRGHIRISTSEDAAFYYISVQDDGVGFRNFPGSDGKKHVGVYNVRSRLEMLCGGSLTIRSVPDVGTESIIQIPKEEWNE